MSSTVASVLRDTRGKGLFLLRHRRSPHEFTLGANLTLTSLLSVVIVLIGYSYAMPPSALAMNKLAGSGALILSSSELVAHAKNVHSSGYWLGPREGNIFLEDENKSGTNTVSYLHKSANSNNKSSRLVTIATYNDKAAFASRPHNLNKGFINEIVTAEGGSVQFDLATMDDEIVTIPGKPQIVVISYPTAQSAETLRADAAKLQLIQ